MWVVRRKWWWLLPERRRRMVGRFVEQLAGLKGKVVVVAGRV